MRINRNLLQSAGGMYLKERATDGIVFCVGVP